jgi:methylated-DNA-[protein]-cysteine S-methyltransferase
MFLFFYNTAIGTMGIEEKDGSICGVYFPGELLPSGVTVYESALIKEAAHQLSRYLLGELRVFTLPLTPGGTPFMKEVWEILCEIPYGETTTYKQIAEKIGRPKAVRAVGLACKRNPLPLFIPCHRVIGSNGHLTGYRGGLKIKEQLLLLERKNAESQGLISSAKV